MKTFQAIFPILALYKDRKDYTIENIDVEDIFDSGTGFFVSETGVFMSVGHNFVKKHNLERASQILFDQTEFQTSDVADFYVILAQDRRQIELKPIIDYQTIYVKEDISENHKGRDLAIGTIQFAEDEKCEPLNIKFETSNELSQLQIQGLKKLEDYDHSRLTEKTTALKVVFYTQKLNLFEPSISKNYNHIAFFGYQEQESDNFISIETKNYTNRDKKLPSDGLHGLSGSSVIENDKCVGVFFAGGEVGSEEENTHGYFIPTTNPYFQRLFYRFQGKLFVKALESFSNSIIENKEYRVILHKSKYFPKGEECVRGKNGQLVTLLCFKHSLIYK